MLEISFFVIYITEMLLKIIALGFIFNRGAYLRDLWNVLDFFVVIASLSSIIKSSTSDSINFSSLRTLRILRPLRTINFIKKLRTLVQTVLDSLPYLLDIFIIILFTLSVFAILGLQLYRGTIKSQCFFSETGKVPSAYDPSLTCGGIHGCAEGMTCGEVGQNPVSGLFSFDNFFEASLSVFIVTSMEGWSLMNNYLIYASSWFSVLYFSAIIFIEAFFLLNLALAVISAKFNEAQDNQKSEAEIGIRNENEDKIMEMYFLPEAISGAKLKSCEGVPLIKMLLFKPERYTQKSR